MKPTHASLTDRDVVLVSATDDGYAMPLAVTIRSALDTLHPDRRMRLYVLDGGLSDASKSRMLWSWNDPRLTVQWVRPDMKQVSDLMVSHQVNAVTYLRLLMPHVLPEEVKRAIYIDADMLVRRDLSQLWDEPQGDHAALAVPCLAAPYIDASVSLPAEQFESCRNRVAACTPVANYRDLGLPADGLYLNGGLLVADIAQWRRRDFARQMLAVLRDHREHVLWWDQYALNVVLAGKWRPLDYRWNQGAHLYTYADWTQSPLTSEQYDAALNDPWIVHFCSPSKPWNYFCRHPYTRDFRRALARTAWNEWRPAKPDKFLKLWWDFHYQPLRQQWKSQTRALKDAIGYKRRKAA